MNEIIEDGNNMLHKDSDEVCENAILHQLDMRNMFEWCKSFNQDISKWNVSNVLASINAFMFCPIEEKYKPNFKK
jgi:surface protein